MDANLIDDVSEDDDDISIIKPDNTTVEEQPEMIFELKTTTVTTAPATSWASKASRKINSKEEINKIKLKVESNRNRNTKNNIKTKDGD